MSSKNKIIYPSKLLSLFLKGKSKMAKKRKYKMTAAHKAALRAAHKKRRGKPRKKSQDGYNELLSKVVALPRRLGRPPKNIVAGNRQAMGFSTRLNAAIERIETVANRLEKVLS